MYAIGREVPGLARSIGATHPKHSSPHIASVIQTVVTVLLTIGFYLLTPNGSDPTQGGYVYEYGLLAQLGTMAILIVMIICSVAVVWYFHVKKLHPGSLLTTGIIPALGGVGMPHVVYLLFSNLSFAGGTAAGRCSTRRSRGSPSLSLSSGWPPRSGSGPTSARRSMRVDAQLIPSERAVRTSTVPVCGSARCSRWYARTARKVTGP